MAQSFLVPNRDYPLTDTNNIVTLPWAQFFAGLFERTGGQEGGSGTNTGQGSIYFGSTAPDGWLICDGSAISRTTYSRLFTILGTTWGAGDGFATFNLPDMRGVFPFGALPSGPDAVGGQGGSNSTQLTINQLPSHRHPLTGTEHTHTVTDPGHSHGVTDPGHDHTVTDPGHDHTIGSDASAGAGDFVAQAAASTKDISTDTATAGITIDMNTTDISVDKSTTGITLSPATSNSTIGLAGLGQSYDSRPAYRAVNFIIKT